LGRIIPTDEYFSEGLKPPTRDDLIYYSTHLLSVYGYVFIYLFNYQRIKIMVGGDIHSNLHIGKG